MFVLIYSIVLVGGDGIYHEAVTGLQRRILKEAGLDENDPATDLPCVPVPIGIIPAGLIVYMNRNMCFPTVWHFDKCKLI